MPARVSCGGKPPHSIEAFPGNGDAELLADFWLSRFAFLIVYLSFYIDLCLCALASAPLHDKEGLGEMGEQWFLRNSFPLHLR